MSCDAKYTRLSRGHFPWWPRSTAAAQILAAHQAHVLLSAGNASGPTMAATQTWLSQQLECRSAEPNSSLGTAIR